MTCIFSCKNEIEKNSFNHVMKANDEILKYSQNYNHLLQLSSKDLYELMVIKRENRPIDVKRLKSFNIYNNLIRITFNKIKALNEDNYKELDFIKIEYYNKLIELVENDSQIDSLNMIGLKYVINEIRDRKIDILKYETNKINFKINRELFIDDIYYLNFKIIENSSNFLYCAPFHPVKKKIILKFHKSNYDQIYLKQNQEVSLDIFLNFVVDNHPIMEYEVDSIYVNNIPILFEKTGLINIPISILRTSKNNLIDTLKFKVKCTSLYRDTIFLRIFQLKF
jgi:hypothetical protein